MDDSEAGVHHVGNLVLREHSLRFLVFESELCPEGIGSTILLPHLDHLPGNLRKLFAGTKDVYDIDFFGQFRREVREALVRFLAENLIRSRVYRDNRVTVVLHVRSDCIGFLLRALGSAHERDHIVFLQTFSWSYRRIRRVCLGRKADLCSEWASRWLKRCFRRKLRLALWSNILKLCLEQ